MSDDRRNQAARWVDAVWGERTGYFAFAIGVGGHFDEHGKYVFQSFQPRYGRWPDDRDRFLDEAIERAERDDVYVVPYLRSTPDRKKGSALASDRLYADLDETPDGQLRTPEGVLLLGPGGLLVDSGFGRHVYARLPEELEPAQLEALNRHLAKALEADAGWAENKLLRLPGTFNHKPRARGHDSVPVRLLDFSPALRDWTASELTELLGQPPPAISVNGTGVTVEPLMPEHVPPHLQKRLDEEPGDRSEQSFAFVAACIDAGLTDAEVMALALQHRPTKVKWGNGAASEIVRSLAKLREKQSAEANPPEPNVTTSAAPTRPFALGLAEFLALDIETPQVLIGNEGRLLLPGAGLVILGAKGGRGKTTLINELMLCLASGVSWLGFDVPRPLRVLLLENDGPPKPYQQKLALRKSTWSHPMQGEIFIRYLDWGRFTLRDTALTDELRAFIQEERIDLVIGEPLDTLGMQGAGAPYETQAFLDLLKETGLFQDVAWWLNHHLRKEDTKDELDQLAGAWSGRPDATLILDVEAGNKARLTFPKVRWSRTGRWPGLLLAFEPEDESFTVIGALDDEGGPRDIVALLTELFSRDLTQWWTKSEMGDKTKGIGADPTKTIGPALEGNPHLFEMRTGEEAQALGRRSDAQVWQLRQGVVAPHDSNESYLDSAGVQGLPVVGGGGLHKTPPTTGDTPRDRGTGASATTPTTEPAEDASGEDGIPW